MEIQFKVEGGVAYFPGLSKPVTIDSAALPGAEQHELEQLVAQARFFDLPSASAARPKAADYQQYTISIAQGGKQHTVRVGDPVANQDVQALVDCLKAHAKKLRAQPQSDAANNSGGSSHGC